MTKRVRIENADTGSVAINVEVWKKGQAGQEDQLLETKSLFNPADLGEYVLTRDRYLVVREA